MAESFEINDEVKVYAKLPSWFKIDSPHSKTNLDNCLTTKENVKDELRN